MTSPYVAVPTPRHLQPWRIVLVVLACIASVPAAVIAAFAAAIVWSGCFIECTEDSGDHLTGGALWLLTAALFLLGPALAGLLLRRWAAVALAAGGVVAVLVTGAVIVGAN